MTNIFLMVLLIIQIIYLRTLFKNLCFLIEVPLELNNLWEKKGFQRLNDARKYLVVLLGKEALPTAVAQEALKIDKIITHQQGFLDDLQVKAEARVVVFLTRKIA